MTILGLLAKMIGPAEALVKFLRLAGDSAPDLKPTADEWIAKLEGAVSEKNLIALAEVLPKEIADIASGKIDPRNHPSDAA